MRKSAVQATYFTNKIGQNQTNPPNIIAFTQEKYLDIMARFSVQNKNHLQSNSNENHHWQWELQLK